MAGRIRHRLSGEENRTIANNIPVVEPIDPAPIQGVPPPECLYDGIILKAHGGRLMVHSDPGLPGRPRTITCTLRGVLKKKLSYSTSGSQPRRVTRAKQPLNSDVAAVGDRVRFSALDEDTGIIEEVLPRSSRFARSGFRGREQTMVTNLDQLVVVFACAEPNPDMWRIDRWLVAAESYGLDPILIANKCDRVTGEEFRARFTEFERVGYRVIRTSAKTGIGVEELRGVLRSRISAFSGPSGVGKSSLLNALQPGLRLDTGDIGNVTFKGRHTTTVRELIPLESGGWVADTPGLRQLELLAMTREELLFCFPEFENALELGCRFRDCHHDNEPGCRLKAAVERGEIPSRRYESFLQLGRELAVSR